MNRLFFCCLFFVVVSCKQEHSQTNRAFYYWKTVFSLDDQDRAKLRDLSINKLYIRFFDVDIDKISGNPVPLGKIIFNSQPGNSFETVPVVYITVKTLKSISMDEVEELAEKIYKEINHIADRDSITFREIQLDCDWTDQTREKYFALIKKLSTLCKSNNISTGATIRLHQIKYYKVTGIPPVSSRMLMFYNMGKITADPEQTSIYSERDADKYVKWIKEYPFPLDVALPAFTMGIVTRKEKVTCLINDISITDVTNNELFLLESKSVFKAKRSFFYKGYYFMEGDRIKLETSDAEVCLSAANKLTQYLRNESRTIAIFDYDSREIGNMKNEELEKIFNCFE